MEKLKLKYESACKAIESLSKAVNKFEKFGADDPGDEFETARDSMIKRFEYSIDTTWKYLKEYLKEKKGIDRRSPKDVFKEVLSVGLSSEKETVEALKMVDARNLTSHTYNEELAGDICEKIPAFFKLMKNFLEKIKPE